MAICILFKAGTHQLQMDVDSGKSFSNRVSPRHSPLILPRNILQEKAFFGLESSNLQEQPAYYFIGDVLESRKLLPKV